MGLDERTGMADGARDGVIEGKLVGLRVDAVSPAD